MRIKTSPNSSHIKWPIRGRHKQKHKIGRDRMLNTIEWHIRAEVLYASRRRFEWNARRGDPRILCCARAFSLFKIVCIEYVGWLGGVAHSPYSIITRWNCFSSLTPFIRFTTHTTTPPSHISLQHFPTCFRYDRRFTCLYIHKFLCHATLYLI